MLEYIYRRMLILEKTGDKSELTLPVVGEALLANRPVLQHLSSFCEQQQSEPALCAAASQLSSLL